MFKKEVKKNLKVIEKIIKMIDVEGLCDIWVEYNPEDGDYEIRSKTTIRYYDMADMTQELGYIEDTIRSWGLGTYVFTPWYVENCEDEIEFLNESDESKQERKFTKLLNNIEEYLNSNSYNSVVRFMVDYDEVMDDVIVEDDVMIGAGSLVPPNKVLESGYLYVGSPVKKVRPLTDKEKAFLPYSAQNYVKVSDNYK